MKTVTLVDFSEIFNYATENYGIDWNTCCDMFHGSEILTYKGTDEISYDDDLVPHESDMTVEEFVAMDIKEVKEDNKANWILGDFMQNKQLQCMTVDNES